MPSNSIECEKYLNAFFEEGPNFVKLSNVYPPESFAMVHERNSEIEKLTQVVLDCQADSLRINIQGNEASIRAARQLIDDLLTGKCPQSAPSAMCAADIETDGGFLSGMAFTHAEGKFHLDSHNNNVIDPKKYPPYASDSMEAEVRCTSGDSSSCTGHDILEAERMDRGCGGSDRQCHDSLSCCHSDARDKLDCPAGTVDNDHCCSSSQTLSPSTSPALSPSCVLEEQAEVKDEGKKLQDQEYKVQRALKLGYSEADALMALARVGSKAGENDYLAELISIGSKSTHSLDSESSASFTSGELDASSHFPAPTSVPEKHEDCDDGDNLRYIVIDGSNVAMSHGKKEIFSCLGIRLAVDWFRQRGHTRIKVFVPQWRKETSRPEAPITGQDILTQLEKEDVLVFTPARRIGGRRVVCYDDRYVLKLAAEEDGIVVSNDNYRDLLNASPDYRKVVEERLLMYSFVNDKFMPPDDPLGRKGPTLDNFLRIRPTVPEPLPPECPYGRKCTYGNKCRYFHPERGCMPHKSVTDKLAEQAKLKMQERSARLAESADRKGKKMRAKTPLTRTVSLVPTSFSGDPCSPLSSLLGQEGAVEADPQLQRSRSLVDKKDYNEMLSEHRRKFNMHMERAGSVPETHVKPGRQAELAERLSTSTDASRHSPTVLIQGPDPAAAVSAPSSSMESQHLMPQRIPSPTFDRDLGTGASLPSPSRSPPSSQLLTPASQSSEREEFFSGHLLLAKKLSDESQDSKFFSDSEMTPSSAEREGSAGSSGAGVVGYLTATSTAAPPGMTQMTASPEMLQQAMSQLSMQRRQYNSSCHSASHPSQHGSSSLASPFPMDVFYGQSDRCMSGPTGQGGSHPDPMFSIGGFHGDHCQSFPLTERRYSHHQVMNLQQQQQQQQKQQGFIDGGQQRSSLLMPRQAAFPGALYDDVLYGNEHMGLTRLQSAPSHLFQTHGQPQPRPITRMARQNSTSDPQLHTAGMDEAADSGLASRSTVQFPAVDSSLAGLNLYEVSLTQQQNAQAHLQHQQQQQQHQQQQQQQHHHQQQQQQQQQQQLPIHSHPHHGYSRSSSFHPGSFSPQPCYPSMNRQSSYTVSTPPRTPQQPPPGWQDAYSAGSQYSGQDPWGMSGGMLSPPSVNPSNPSHLPPPQSPMRPRMVPQFNPDADIPPSDPRYNLYYHLCGLFPAPKVRAVMNRYPNETNPQDLCSYIIGLK